MRSWGTYYVTRKLSSQLSFYIKCIPNRSSSLIYQFLHLKIKEVIKSIFQEFFHSGMYIYIYIHRYMHGNK